MINTSIGKDYQRKMKAISNNIHRISSYDLPSTATVYSTPYVVINNSSYHLDYLGATFNDGIITQEPFEIEQKIEENRQGLLNLLDALIASQKNTEGRLLRGMLETYKLDSEFYNKMQGLLASGQYSQLFTLLKMKENNYYDAAKDIKTNLKQNIENWARFQNQQALNILHQAFYNEVINGTLTKRGGIGLENFINSGAWDSKLKFEDILRRAQEIADLKLAKNNKYTKEYKEYMSKNFEKFLEDYTEIKAKQYDISPQTLKMTTMNGIFKNELATVENDIVKYSSKITTKNKRYTSMADFGKHMTKGAAGLLAESLNGIRVGGAKDLIEFEVWGKSNTTDRLEQKTDAFEIYNGSITLGYRSDDTAMKKIKEDLNRKSDLYTEDLNKIIQKQTRNSDSIIIHYSAKDYHLFNQFSNAEEKQLNTIKNKALQITTNSSLQARIPIIKQIAAETGNADVETLGFTLLNTSIEGVAAGKTEELKNNLSTMIIAWMFEDYRQTYKLVEVGQTGNEVHVFNEGNTYYLMSDMLEQVRDQVTSSPTYQLGSLVRTTLIPNNSTIYEDEVRTHGSKQGMARWNYVAQNTAKETKLGFHINWAELTRLIMDIDFYKLK